MKFTAKRLIGAGVMAFGVIVAPIAVTVGLPVLSSGPGSVASAQPATCTPATAGDDAVCYVQSAGSPPDTYQYDNGVSPAPQTANVSGTCATTTPGAPLLQMCGFVYPSNTYSGASKPANLGTQGTATGVAGVSPAWTIDNKLSGSKQQADALDFSPGGVGTVVNNRPFNDAQFQIQRKDTGVAQNPFVTVQLAELNSSNKWVTQDCTITGNTGTMITADTSGPGTGGDCVPAGDNGTPDPGGNGGPAPATFTTVEVRDFTVSTSISVVNTSTFTLGNQVCGGQSINATGTGGVVAALSLTGPSSQCKSYTSFSSSIVSGQGPTLSFDGFSTSSVQFTVQIAWPLEPLCQPYTDTTANAPPGGTGIPADLTLPVCAVHHVQFNGVNYDQTYCPAPETLPTAENEPQAGLCTANKQYNDDSTSINAGVETATPLSLASTAVGSPSSGVDVSSFTSGSPGTLNVGSTALFPPSGNVLVATSTGSAMLSYASIGSGTTLNGVVLLSGTGTLTTGNSVIVPATQVVETWVGFIDWHVW